MCALREDLIAIGGADEHMDYLGHICGPYEMTFRLVNAGKKEVWHQEEFLYHVWHPGSDGRHNYFGPHDGLNVSTTALEIRRSGRVMPLVENPAIRLLRFKQDDILYEPLLSQAIPEEDIKGWLIRKLGQHSTSFWNLGNLMSQPIANLRLIVTFLKMLARQFHMKMTKFSRQPKSFKDVLGKIYKTYDFLKNMSQYNAYILSRCKICLNELASSNVRDFAIYGAGDIAEILYKLTLDAPVKISAVYDGLECKKFFSFNVMYEEAIKGYTGKVVVASLVGLEEKIERLRRLGVDRERIIVLQ